MKLRIISVLLALLLLAGQAVLPAAAADFDRMIQVSRVVPALKAFFAGAEGDYGSVNADDNGAVSVGLLQWHGERALELLRIALERYPITANYLTPELYREITDPDTDWDNRILTQREKTCVSAMLDSREGRILQDEAAETDICGYLEEGWAAGMRTDETILYYATIRNQFGPVGAKTYLSHIRTAMGLDSDALFYDLEALHRGVHNTLSYGQRYLALRDKTYEYIRSLKWEQPILLPLSPETGKQIGLKELTVFSAVQNKLPGAQGLLRPFWKAFLHALGSRTGI